jgi:hypothetical protein
MAVPAGIDFAIFEWSRRLQDGRTEDSRI